MVSLKNPFVWQVLRTPYGATDSSLGGVTCMPLTLARQLVF